MMQFDGNFSDQTKRVIFIFLAMSIPLVFITAFLAVPDSINGIISVVTRLVYLTRRRLGVGWIHDETAVKYHLRRGDTWDGYHRWLCSVGWERKEGTHPKRLVVTRDDNEQKVDLVLGTWLHLRHAWQNIR